MLRRSRDEQLARISPIRVSECCGLLHVYCWFRYTISITRTSILYVTVFMRADEEDKAGNASKTTAKIFYSAGTFFDILDQFGPVDEEVGINSERRRIDVLFLPINVVSRLFRIRS
jgi:hypothetical protein